MAPIPADLVVMHRCDLLDGILDTVLTAGDSRLDQLALFA